jgi:GDP-mannose 6-dehydrogenase
MNISIFGLGYVGCVSLGCLARNGHRVVGVDINPNKVDLINQGRPTIIERDIEGLLREQHARGLVSATMDAQAAVAATDLSMVAVGTPSTGRGHLNLAYIFKVAEDIGRALARKDGFHIVVVRSTVLPGTCDRIARLIEEHSGKQRNRGFAVVDNPEFLREGTAVADYSAPPLTLIGADHPGAARTVAGLYEHLPGEIVITDLAVAEIMKYVSNTYHALKISFANEIGNICAELGIDSHKVMEIFCKDRQLNISPHYFKPGFAYGGSCLPKDLGGLQALAHDLYVPTPVIDGISVTNENQIRRAVSILRAFSGKRYGILGLSFKEGTDDLRNSPSVRVVEALLGKGEKVRIYDRNVSETLLTGTNKDFVQARLPHLSSLLCSDLREVVAESEVLVIATADPDFLEVVSVETERTIVDFVRLSDALLGRPNYIGINWSMPRQSAGASAEDTVL